jgi:four helix bundle protein
VDSERKIRNFKDLIVWQKGMGLVIDIYRMTNLFPSIETYGIVSQMRRAAISIPSNIAEGFMRRHNKEYKQFLHVALGSLAELETQIILSERLGFTNNQQSTDIQAHIIELNKMIMSLIKRL